MTFADYLQLDAMPEDEIAKLFEKFKVAEKKGEPGEDEIEEGEAEPEEQSPEPASEDGEALVDVRWLSAPSPPLFSQRCIC